MSSAGKRTARFLLAGASLRHFASFANSSIRCVRRCVGWKPRFISYRAALRSTAVWRMLYIRCGEKHL